MSSVSTSLYGIHPHDDHGLHQNLMAQIDASPSMGSGEPFYPTLFDGVPTPFFPNPNNISATQSPHEELVVPTFLTNGVTNDAGLAPAFPTYNAVPHSSPFVTSSLFFSGLPTSPGSTLAPSRGPSRGNLPKRKRKSDDDYTKRIAMYLAKSKKVAPTRKPYGAGFRDMFDKLPLEVQRALNTFYTGCCESTTGKANSTRKKHMFSKQHCLNLPKEYLDMIPCFVCPAYIAFHGRCTKARPGRYDSTDRHCKGCAGFQEMNSKCEIFPLKITKEEHEAVTTYRETDKNGEVEEKTERLVDNSVNKLLGMMVGHEKFQIHEAESNFSEAIHTVSESGIT
ncbi:hypothetical protein BGY98DRAFT_1099095 [Russula aff. rugulosa BPL654]|nr:hypothetical protein BGY98DRAFT_1099095 [Russula aff. rugulosa BPL654]